MNEPIDSARTLRLRAEQQAEADGPDPEDGSDRQALVHELHVRQVELEIQNEELREAMDRVAESERKFKLASDGASECITWTDPDGATHHLSEGCRTLAGMPEEGRPIASFDELEELIHPSDRDAFRRHHQHALSNPEPDEMVFRIVRTDGQQRWVAHRCQPMYDERGRFIGRRSVNTDITEKRDAELALARKEAQYRKVVETTADGYWMLDHTGRILSVNEAYARRSGYSRDELVGMSVAELDALESPDDTAAHIERIVHLGTDLFETQHRAKNGEIWPVEVNVSYWPESGGRVFGFLRDLTRRKEADAELKTLRREMRRLSELQVARQTVAAIAHELNQPLNAIAMYTEAALRLLGAGTPQPERLRHAVEACGQQAERAGNVVRELVGFMGAGEVQLEPVDLGQLVPRVLGLLESPINGDFKPQVELDSGLGPVLANQLQIEKVLTILIENAIDAMRNHDGSGHELTIAVSRYPEGNMAEVVVTDHGPGIEAQSLQHIFDPFFTTKRQGLGMGLSISRGIVEAHGGRLWAESEVGSGARFHFTLPLAS